MPTTYAHYKFGKEVISALPRPLRSTVENHRELFDIGLHGPDILFYYHPMKRNTVNGQGYDLHDKPADLFFRHAAETVKKAEDPAAARAYIYGVICHFAFFSHCIFLSHYKIQCSMWNIIFLYSLPLFSFLF